MEKISEHGLLEVLADFDELGGASPGLVAWEREWLWRLTAEGWRARATRR